jgi:pyridinium-3,5-biscarboxylic acid mononucleotide sulfurtransferase
MSLNSPPGPRRHPVPAETIIAGLSGCGPALVALSGGVDSSVVALLAYRALGQHAIAVTLTGPAVSAEEVDSATEVARAIGIQHVLLSSDPLSDRRYVENPANRCYFCRAHEGGLLREWGEQHSIVLYLDGVHLDDFGEDRPGLQAMNEHGFRHPLAEAGWTKSDIRDFAHSAGLPTWDRPSNACLASRVAHGQLITPELLEQVARAEEWVSSRGYRRVRVRVSAGRARVEVDPDEIPDLLAEAVPLTEALTGLGFASVEIDPHGYRPRANA